MKFPTFKLELEYLSRGASVVIGTDEVGTGPLAGPVVASAVVLRPESVSGRQRSGNWFARIRDSKTVGEAERVHLAALIKENALAWSVAEVSVEEIDTMNIRCASWLAMREAVKGVMAQLGAKNGYTVLIDGKFKVGELGVGVEETAVVGGDAKILSIAAASLIAKVHRDSLMVSYASKFPAYGFERHKGYGTAVHIAAIRQHGSCAIHRKTFLKNLA
jgi:ribonuclease HII